MTSRLRQLGTPLAVISAVAAVYIDALDAPFLWDDLPLLEQNCVRKLCGAANYLMTPFWDLSVKTPNAGILYRPLTTLSFAIDGLLHGQNATGFHVTNLIFHILNVILVCVLARRLGASRISSGLAALIWGLLPRLVESVAWVSGRTDVLYTSAALASILVWKAGSQKRTIISLGLGIVAVLAKEAGLSVLLALTIAEFTHRSGRNRWAWSVLPAGALGLYILLREYVLRHSMQAVTIALTPARRLLTIAEAIGRYAWMSIDLWHPATQIGVVSEPRMGFVYLGVFVALTLSILFYRFRSHLSGFAWSIAVLGATPLLLVIHVIGMPWIAVAGDRLGYLPWAVLAAVAARVTTTVSENLPRTRVWGLAAALIIAATLVPKTRQRVAAFSDEVDFWIDAVDTTAPTNWGPTMELSGLYLRGGLPEQSLAIAESLKKRCQAPVTFHVPEAISKALSRMGQYGAALDAYREEPAHETPEWLLTSARFRLSLLDIDGAEQAAKTSLQMYSDYADANATLHTISRLRMVLDALLQASAGRDRDILLAERDMLSGRLIEAGQRWLPLLDGPEVSNAIADEGFAFLTRFAEPSVLDRALASYQRRKDHSPFLVAAAEASTRFAQRLEINWPRVERILKSKNASSGRCHDYGLFSG
jgi:protein O-mannosyl-transferase